MATMQSAFLARSYVTSSGNVYTSDSITGIIANVGTVQDVTDLISMGVAVVNPPPTDLIFKLLGANFNVTTDQIMPTTFSGGKWRIRRITVLNTTVNGMSTAVGGFYTATAKGGSAIVANTQVYTGLTNALTALDLTLNLPNLILVSGTHLYFSLSTPQGAPATADICVYGDVYV